MTVIEVPEQETVEFFNFLLEEHDLDHVLLEIQTSPDEYMGIACARVVQVLALQGDDVLPLCEALVSRIGDHTDAYVVSTAFALETSANEGHNTVPALNSLIEDLDSRADYVFKRALCATRAAARNADVTPLVETLRSKLVGREATTVADFEGGERYISRVLR